MLMVFPFVSETFQLVLQSGYYNLFDCPIGAIGFVIETL